MKDTDKPRDKVSGFVQKERTFSDGIRNNLEKTVRQSVVSEEEAAGGFVSDEDEMAMDTLYQFKRYNGRPVIEILSTVGGAKLGVAAKRDELEVVTMGGVIHGATIKRVPTVNDLINVFHDDRSGFYIVFDDFVIVLEYLLNHTHEITME